MLKKAIATILNYNKEIDVIKFVQLISNNYKT